MTLTTLPAVLEPVVRQVEDTYKTSYSGQTVKANIHGVILAFLNAALEAGVAINGKAMTEKAQGTYVENAIIIRTGDT